MEEERSTIGRGDMEGQDNDISSASTLRNEEDVSFAPHGECSEMSGESLSSTFVAKKLMELEAERNKVRKDIGLYRKRLAEGEQRVTLKTKEIEDLEKRRVVAEIKEEFYATTLNFISSGSSPESVKIKLLVDLTNVMKGYSSNMTNDQFKETMKAAEGIFFKYLESEAAYHNKPATSTDPSYVPAKEKLSLIESLRNIDELPRKVLRPTTKSRPIKSIQNEDEILDDEEICGASAPTKAISKAPWIRKSTAPLLIGGGSTITIGGESAANQSATTLLAIKKKKLEDAAMEKKKDEELGKLWASRFQNSMKMSAVENPTSMDGVPNVNVASDEGVKVVLDMRVETAVAEHDNDDVNDFNDLLVIL